MRRYFPLHRRLVRSALVAGLVFVAGCGCTLIGCVNGLTVVLSERPAGPYRVELVVNDDGTRYVFECGEGDAGCSDRIFYPDFRGEHVWVHVTSAAGTVVREVRPRYSSRYPNGRRCGPECVVGEVLVPV